MKKQRGQKSWIERAGNRTDLERTHSKPVGRKMRRIIEAWEFIRNCARWTPARDLRVRLVFTSRKKKRANGSTAEKRAARRILYTLHAAGLVDLKPWPPQMGTAVSFRRRQ